MTVKYWRLKSETVVACRGGCGQGTNYAPSMTSALPLNLELSVSHVSPCVLTHRVSCHDTTYCDSNFVTETLKYTGSDELTASSP